MLKYLTYMKFALHLKCVSSLCVCNTGCVCVSVSAGLIWSGLCPALLLPVGNIMSSRHGRLRLSSWIHGQRLRAQ